MELEFQMKESGFKGQLSYGEIDVSGNEEFGHRPGELMVTSIAVCSGGVLRKILEKQRINIEDIKIKADVERKKEEVDPIVRIRLHFTIRGAGLNESRIDKAIQLASKNCPMVQSVKDSIEVIETFELIKSKN